MTTDEVSYGTKEQYTLVLVHYKLFSPDLIALRADEVEQWVKSVRGCEIVCEGSMADCYAIADVIRSSLELNQGESNHD